jgi:raffinose/stachyose/melibiose transport system substrate-binding protein
MMTKKLLLMALFAASVAGLVFAGGSGQESGGGKKVTLQAYYYDVGRDKEYNALYNAFSSKFPNITVETTLNGIDYQSNLLTMIASNTMPDLVAGEYQGMYDLGSAGHLADLTNEPFIANFSKEILAQMTAPDGKVYGIPTNIAAMGIFYNQEMFEKAGIAEFPKTISAFDEACRKLKAAGFIPFSLAGTEAWTLGQMCFVEIASVQPDVLKFSAQSAGKPGADIMLDKMLYGFKSLDIQFKNAIDTAPSNDYGTFINDFASGKVAMIHMGTWALKSIIDLGPKFTVRYGAPPFTENPKDVRLSVNISVSTAIGAQTKHKAEALQLFNYLASVEGNTEFGRLFGEIPVIPGAQFNYTPCTSDIKGYIDAGAICPWSQVLMSEAGRAEGSTIMQSYYFGKISAEEAIKGVYDNWFK